jgi:uncharacterized cofD-like protein
VLVPGGPAVVALGGGHGLARALATARRYAGRVAAVVSTADDGGSSGRLRRDHGVPAPGDLRKCLVALAGNGTETLPWIRALEHRFGQGELEGHALGNLLIVGLAEALDDFASALDEIGRLVHAVGRVMPATTQVVTITADVEGGPVEGQVAVMTATGRIRRIALQPPDVVAYPDAVAAIRSADQVVLGPGSLFTSVMPVVCVPGIARALRDTSATVVQVCNVGNEVPETEGFDAADHLRAVLDHGGRVDVFVQQRHGELCAEPADIEALGARCVTADVVQPDGMGHDPDRLASVLSSL